MAKLGNIFSNPLIDTLLVADAASNIASSAAAAKKAALEPDPTTIRFSMYAAAKGEPVTEIPREGFFGKLGAKMGILSPTVKATPDQLLAENVAINERGAMMIDEATKLANMRKTMGMGNYSRMISNDPMLARVAHQTGMDNLTEPTVQESAIAALQGKRASDVQHQKVMEGQGQERINLQRGVEANRTRALNLAVEKETPGTPLFEARQKADVEKAQQIANVRTIGVGEAVAGNWSAWEQANKNKTYLDLSTNTPIDKRKYASPQAARDAANAGLLYLANPSEVQGAITQRKLDANVARMEALVPQLFISKAGKPNKVLLGDIAANALKYRTTLSSSQVKREWDSLMVESIGYAKLLNGRFPNTAELTMVQENAFPNFTGERNGIGIKIDTAESATQLLMTIRRNAKNGTVAAFAANNNNNTNDEAAAAATEALYGGGDSGLDPAIAAALGAPGVEAPPAEAPTSDPAVEGAVSDAAAGRE